MQSKLRRIWIVVINSQVNYPHNSNSICLFHPIIDFMNHKIKNVETSRNFYGMREKNTIFKFNVCLKIAKI